jgi:hypothetical protein
MPVVGVGLVHNKACCSVGMPAARFHQTHYWALRQQARARDCPGGSTLVGSVLLLPHFGGGVWCLICG